jgi:hypothetical protein
MRTQIHEFCRFRRVNKRFNFHDSPPVRKRLRLRYTSSVAVRHIHARFVHISSRCFRNPSSFVFRALRARTLCSSGKKNPISYVQSTAPQNKIVHMCTSWRFYAEPLRAAVTEIVVVKHDSVSIIAAPAVQRFWRAVRNYGSRREKTPSSS